LLKWEGLGKPDMIIAEYFKGLLKIMKKNLEKEIKKE
jgi:hypothetical protein